MIHTSSFKLAHLGFISKKQIVKHLQNLFISRCLQEDSFILLFLKVKPEYMEYALQIVQFAWEREGSLAWGPKSNFSIRH